MIEFGHSGHRVTGGGFIDAWGKGPFELTVRGKTYRFEDSDRFGPIRLNKDDEPAAVNFGARSPFWRAYKLWRSQGRPLNTDGISCIYREPIPTIVQKIGPLFITLQNGEPNEDGATRYVQVEAPKRGSDK